MLETTKDQTYSDEQLIRMYKIMNDDGRYDKQIGLLECFVEYRKIDQRFQDLMASE